VYRALLCQDSTRAPPPFRSASLKQIWMPVKRRVSGRGLAKRTDGVGSAADVEISMHSMAAIWASLPRTGQTAVGPLVDVSGSHILSFRQWTMALALGPVPDNGRWARAATRPRAMPPAIARRSQEWSFRRLKARRTMCQGFRCATIFGCLLLGLRGDCAVPGTVFRADRGGDVGLGRDFAASRRWRGGFGGYPTRRSFVVRSGFCLMLTELLTCG
jgi:hypothetical protein